MTSTSHDVTALRHDAVNSWRGSSCHWLPYAINRIIIIVRKWLQRKWSSVKASNSKRDVKWRQQVMTPLDYVMTQSSHDVVIRQWRQVIDDSVKQYVGAPIDCWCPAQFTQSHVDYTNTICWVNRLENFHHYRF